MNNINTCFFQKKLDACFSRYVEINWSQKCYYQKVHYSYSLLLAVRHVKNFGTLTSWVFLIDPEMVCIMYTIWLYEWIHESCSKFQSSSWRMFPLIRNFRWIQQLITGYHWTLDGRPSLLAYLMKPSWFWILRELMIQEILMLAGNRKVGYFNGVILLLTSSDYRHPREI